MIYVYYKVTAKKLAAVLQDWHDRRSAAVANFLKFSRRHGGSHSHLQQRRRVP